MNTTGHGADMAAEIKRLAEAMADSKAERWCGRGRGSADPELWLRERAALIAAIDRMRDALAAAHEHIAEIQAAYEATETERQLTVHKVITCSVAARDPVKASQGVYANEWDSPQAEEVRKLRADRDRLAALASCAKQGEPVATVDADGFLVVLSKSYIPTGTLLYSSLDATAEANPVLWAVVAHDGVLFSTNTTEESANALACGTGMRVRPLVYAAVQPADRLCQDEPGSGARGLSIALASKPDARHVVREAIAKLPTYVVEWGGARFMCVDRDAAMDAAAPPSGATNGEG